MAFPENQVDKLARQRRAEAFARQQPGYVPPASTGRVAPPRVYQDEAGNARQLKYGNSQALRGGDEGPNGYVPHPTPTYQYPSSPADALQPANVNQAVPRLPGANTAQPYEASPQSVQLPANSTVNMRSPIADQEGVTYGGLDNGHLPANPTAQKQTVARPQMPVGPGGVFGAPRPQPSPSDFTYRRRETNIPDSAAYTAGMNGYDAVAKSREDMMARNNRTLGGMGVPNPQQQRLAEQYKSVMAGQPVGSGALPAQESRFPRQPPPNNRYQGSVPLEPSRDLSGANGVSYEGALSSPGRAFLPRNGGGIDTAKFVEGDTLGSGAKVVRTANGGIGLVGGGVPRTDKDTAKLMERRAALSQAYKDTRALRAFDRNPQLANKKPVLDAIKRASLGPAVAAAPLVPDVFGAKGTDVINPVTKKPFTEQELANAGAADATAPANVPAPVGYNWPSMGDVGTATAIGATAALGGRYLIPRVAGLARGAAIGVGNAFENSLGQRPNSSVITGKGGTPIVAPQPAPPPPNPFANTNMQGSGQAVQAQPVPSPKKAGTRPNPLAGMGGSPLAGMGSSPPPAAAPTAATSTPAPAPTPAAQVPAPSVVAGTPAAQASTIRPEMRVPASPSQSLIPTNTYELQPPLRTGVVDPQFTDAAIGIPPRNAAVAPPAPATPETPVPAAATVGNTPAAKSSLPPLTSQQAANALELVKQGAAMEDAIAQSRGASPLTAPSASVALSPERQKAIQNTLDMAGGDPAKVEQIFNNRNKSTNGAVSVLSPDELQYMRSQATTKSAPAVTSPAATPAAPSPVPPTAAVGNRNVKNAPTTAVGGVTPQRQAELDKAALVEADLRKRGELPASPRAGQNQLGRAAEAVPATALGEMETAGVQVRKSKAETPLQKQQRIDDNLKLYDTPEKRIQFMESKKLKPGRATTMAWRKELGMEPESRPLNRSTGNILEDTRAKIKSLPAGDPGRPKLESLLKTLETKQPTTPKPQPNRSGKLNIGMFIPTNDQIKQAQSKIYEKTPEFVKRAASWGKGTGKGGVSSLRGPIGLMVAEKILNSSYDAAHHVDGAPDWMPSFLRDGNKTVSEVNRERERSIYGDSLTKDQRARLDKNKGLYPARPIRNPFGVFGIAAGQDGVSYGTPYEGVQNTQESIARRQPLRSTGAPPIPYRPQGSDEAVATQFLQRVGRYPSAVEFTRFKLTGATPSGGF